MAINRKHIAMCGSFSNGQKKALLDTFEETDAVVTPTAGPADLTDSTTGTPGATLAAIAAVAISSSGGNTYADTTVNTAVNLAVTPIRNAIASLNAQLVALENALQTSGVLT